MWDCGGWRPHTQALSPGFRAPGGRGLASIFSLAGLVSAGNSDIQGGPSSDTKQSREPEGSGQSLRDPTQKTVRKWRNLRSSATDLPTGPKKPPGPQFCRSRKRQSIAAFRRHTLLPLDDCLYALQATIPHLSRAPRCPSLPATPRGSARLPNVEGDKPAKKKFKKAYPIGFFHIDIAEVRTEEGKLYLFVAIDRTSKFAFARLGRRRHGSFRLHFSQRSLHPSRSIQNPHGPDR